MDPELQAELELQIKELTDLLSQQTSAMVGMGKALNDTYSSINNLNNTVKKTNTSQNEQNQNLANNNNGQAALQRANASATKMIDETSAALNAALTSTGTALNSLGRSILNGEQGFSKYNSAIGTLGDAAWSVGKNFGILGVILGGFLKVTSEVLQYQTKQADALLSASDSFQKMGAVNAMSVMQIREMGKRAGLTSLDLEKMIKPMQSVSRGFIALGTTQAQGVKAFGEMINSTEEVRRQFLKLGLTDQDRIQMSADFVEYLNAGGQTLRDQSNTRGGLAKASMDYTKRVYELADLTGVDIETAKKKILAEQENQTVAIHSVEVARQRDEKRKIINSNAPAAEKAAAQRELEEIDRKEAAFQKFSDGMSAAGYKGDKLAALQAQYLTGIVTENSKFAAIQGLNISKMKDGLEKGTMGVAEVDAQANDAARDSQKRVGEAFLLLGKGTELLGIDVDVARATAQRTGTEIRKAGDESVKRTAGLLAGQGPVGADPAQKARGDLVESERKIRMTIDDYALMYNPLLGNTGMLSKLAWAVGLATAALLALAAKKMYDGMRDFVDNFRKGGKGASEIAEVAGKEAGAAERNISRRIDKNGREYFVEEGKGRISAAEANTSNRIKAVDSLGREYHYDPSTGKRVMSSAAAEAAAMEAEAPGAARGLKGMLGRAGAFAKESKVLGAIGKGGRLLGRLAAPIAVATSLFDAYQGWTSASEEQKAGRISEAEANRRKGEAAGSAAGGAAGAWAGAEGGAVLGAALGSVVPGLGTAIGGIAGGLIGGALGYFGGSWAGGKLGGAAGSAVGGDTQAKAQQGQQGQQNKPEEQNKQLTPIEVLKNTLDQVDLLQKYAFNKDTITNNAEALSSFANALSSVFDMGAEGSTGDKAKAVAEAIIAFNASNPPFDKFLYFSNLPINSEQSKHNSEAYVAFATAMSSYKGMGGSGLSKITNTIAMAIAEHFKVKIPFVDFLTFAYLPLDPKKVETNSKAFVNFANAMAEYKGGPGLADVISSWAGSKFQSLFGQDGPVAAFRKFAKEDFGPNMSKNADAFQKYAQSAMNIANNGGSPGGGAPGGSPGGAPGGSPGGAPGGAPQSPLQSGMNAGEKTAGFIGGLVSGGAALIGKGWEAAKSAVTGMHPSSEKELRDAGLKIKGGDVQGEGYPLDNRIIPFAKGVQSNIPGFVQFNSFNDRFHHGLSYHSLHKDGKAVDFSLKRRPSVEEGKALVRMLQDAGATKAMDEYNFPSTAATGGHMHAQFAKKGGVFAGPLSGYPVEMHGSEMVAPLNMNSILMKLAKTPINEVTSTISTTRSVSKTTSSTKTNNEQSVMNLELYGMINAKVDKMITILESSHDKHNKILRAAKV